MEKLNKMKTCIVYRTKADKFKKEHEVGHYNDSKEPQFEACVFSDGKVAQKWLTHIGSMVWWDSWENLANVHFFRHPDYGTRIEWADGNIEEL